MKKNYLIVILIIIIVSFIFLFLGKNSETDDHLLLDQDVTATVFRAQEKPPLVGEGLTQTLGCAHLINYGGGSDNCSVTWPDCSIESGSVQLTSQDESYCDNLSGGNDYMFMGCMESRCLGYGVDGVLVPIALNSEIDFDIGEVNNLVFDVEQKLRSKGFFFLDPGNVFRGETFDAIKSFQLANRLPVTGVLNSQTINFLLR
jgi:hypothetical protein